MREQMGGARCLMPSSLAHPRSHRQVTASLPQRCSHRAVRVCHVCAALLDSAVRTHFLLWIPVGKRTYLAALRWLRADPSACTHTHACSTSSAARSAPPTTPQPPRLPPAAAQVWFGVEIVLDWMVHSYRKLTGAGKPCGWAGWATCACRSGCWPSAGVLAAPLVQNSLTHPLIPTSHPLTHVQSMHCCGPPLLRSCR